MKKLLIAAMVTVSAVVLLAGCLALQVGGDGKQDVHKPTIGEQLIDLKTARDAGAITEPEYEAQKAKLLRAE